METGALLQLQGSNRNGGRFCAHQNYRSPPTETKEYVSHWQITRQADVVNLMFLEFDLIDEVADKLVPGLGVFGLIKKVSMQVGCGTISEISGVELAMYGGTPMQYGKKFAVQLSLPTLPMVALPYHQCFVETEFYPVSLNTTVRIMASVTCFPSVIASLVSDYAAFKYVPTQQLYGRRTFLDTPDLERLITNGSARMVSTFFSMMKPRSDKAIRLKFGHSSYQIAVVFFNADKSPVQVPPFASMNLHLNGFPRWDPSVCTTQDWLVVDKTVAGLPETSRPFPVFTMTFEKPPAFYPSTTEYVEQKQQQPVEPRMRSTCKLSHFDTVSLHIEWLPEAADNINVFISSWGCNEFMVVNGVGALKMP